VALKTTLPRGVELTITPRQQVTTDGVSGGLRTFFDPVVRPEVVPPLLPREQALQVLKGGARLFRWQESIPDLAEKSIIAGESLSSVRFQQTFKGVPVDGAEVVVNVCADGRLQSLYSQYRYDIPAGLDPTAIRFDRGRARALVARLSRKAVQRTIGPARLMVY
jgi:Fungalysin/Thermolysin Propeptide Motif